MDMEKSRKVQKNKQVLFEPDFFMEVLEEVAFIEIHCQNAGG